MDHQDETIERMLNSSPLICFSVYTHIQVETLENLGNDLLEILDASIERDEVSEEFHQAYGKFWLWVLGAYDVVRTMTDDKTGAAHCFSNRIKVPLKQLKTKLAVIRIPFAKQEIRGKKQFISGEASITRICLVDRDFSFDIDGQVISARKLVAEFQAVFSQITRSDVLKDLRSTEP